MAQHALGGLLACIDIQWLIGAVKVLLQQSCA